MNTGTPNSNARTRSNPQRPHAARTGNIARQIAAALIAAFALAIVATALLLVTPSAQAQMVNNAPTGLPGIVDQANPNQTLTTLRPGMTLEAVTSGIMDSDGLPNPSWMYQWAHSDGTNVTDISGATASTYLIGDDDLGKALIVKVTFEDDAMNSEGPLVSSPTPFVGPTGLIVWNTQSDPMINLQQALTATRTKFAQGFQASSAAKSFTLDFVELTLDNIGNTATIGAALTVTLNADSSGSPGTVLCTLEDPATFSTSGAHKFYAPAAAATTSGLCPQLEASNAYHIVVEMDSDYTETVSVTHYQSRGQSRGRASGWTIPNDAQEYSSSAWADNTLSVPMLIDVRTRPDFELEELTEKEVPFGWSLTPDGIAGGEKFRSCS